MYPNFYYLIKDLFHIDFYGLSAINTFGFFTALGLAAAIYFFKNELKNKEKEGLLTFAEKKNQHGVVTEKKWPHERVGQVTLIALIGGIVGGKLFYCLENWDEFVADPQNALLSFSGMTFYGSLIVSTLFVWIYFKRNKIPPIIVADAIAPALMIGYAIGRIGCHLAGDGDWGKINIHPKPFNALPDWLWSYTYPHNVLSEGVFISGCDWGNYCNQLEQGVYPTSLYETILCAILFAILWSTRKKISIPGRLFALYLMFNGTERMLIGSIRENPTMNLLGLHVTQVELIGSIIILTGALLYYFSPQIKLQQEIITDIQNQ
ncbi:prolipoprotein diacylglyceryl transferase [Chitinophagaceae bacterium 26-R-25]|nr:prolipoprotein diacylglyceryl transferase [Chitinophagaceae bacterium 26-R-25]